MPDHALAPDELAMIAATVARVRADRADARVMGARYDAACEQIVKLLDETVAQRRRIAELETALERKRDSIAARIVDEEQGVQQEITKEPLNSWLAGVLFGLQRARDIATDALERARENGDTT
ncbi:MULTISPECIES: hypothetical protein [unclassified Nocardiopsis]|uniref:hypothetical protein n=1 Tax=Nocardiopsis TaxID=2013 RepID=UPI00387AB2BF